MAHLNSCWPCHQRSSAYATAWYNIILPDKVFLRHGLDCHRHTVALFGLSYELLVVLFCIWYFSGEQPCPCFITMKECKTSIASPCAFLAGSQILDLVLLKQLLGIWRPDLKFISFICHSLGINHSMNPPGINEAHAHTATCNLLRL